MSQYDDGIEQQAKSTYLDEVNHRIRQLEAENSFLSHTIKTKVINKRTKTVRTKTIFQVNEERRSACIKRYWTRIPHSNSLKLEYDILK